MMNAHAKTCLTLAILVAVITFLCFHPNIAWRLYQGFWVMIGIATIAWIYALIYTCFDN